MKMAMLPPDRELPPAIPVPKPLDAGGSPSPAAELVESLDLPIIVVGRDLAVLSVNRAAATLLSLSTSDIGRPVWGIRMLADVTDLKKRCEGVIGGVAFSQSEVRDRKGSWFSVRITPYTGSDHQRVGAVLSLVNVTGLRASLEQAIYERQYTKAIINTVIDPLVVLDEDFRVQAANQAFYAMFQLVREQAHGVRLYDLGKGAWDIPRLQTWLIETGSDNPRSSN